MTMNRLANILLTPSERALEAAVKAPQPIRFGHVVSVTGIQAVAVLERLDPANSGGTVGRIEIGSLVKIPTPFASVIGIISGMSTPMPSGIDEKADELSLIEISLAGEIYNDDGGRKLRFTRGVAHFPTIGDAVMPVTGEELSIVYRQPQAATIDVGTLYQDSTVPALFLIDELFGKHFIVVGTTGSGKSSAVTCILSQVLIQHHSAHIVVLDIHNEYARAFGNKAELITPGNLRLPFWLLNFQELCAALTGTDGNHDAEVEILSEAILASKRRYFEMQSGRIRRVEGAGITVDTPSPFRLADVTAFLDEQVGKLDRAHGTLPYRRLRTRIDALVSDPRYGFMFGSYTVEDTMVDVLSRIFRVPNEGRPITVIDLASVPAEILDIVISLLARLAFDLAVWSEGTLPMLIVCEEAHRYAPANTTDRFLPTRQALARIAKEGRKYGVSLALVTQRPSELDTTIISQCSTAIALRLTTDRDQEVMRANTHDSALDLLAYLPLLGDREAIVLGQGGPMPMRIRFHPIDDNGLPKSRHEGFSKSWKENGMDRRKLEETVARWRYAGRQR
jgi:DNA helicase HerA-like ATPase